MSDSATESESVAHMGIREDLVRTAVSFLQNPRVIGTSLAQKQKFLQRKGLTNEEIEKACEIAGVYTQYEQQIKNQPVLPPIPMNRSQIELTFFHKLREIVHSFAVFSIVGYALYKIYENYIAPFLFGRKKKDIDQSLDNLDKSVNELKNSLKSVKVEVDKLNRNTDWHTERYLNEIKSDVSTVKGLLLGRKQFPSVSNSPVVPPSIPAWQMSSVTDGDNDHKTEEMEELGSGSGSSEPEHCTKTSESSLEIIPSPKDEDDSDSFKGKKEFSQ